MELDEYLRQDGNIVIIPSVLNTYFLELKAKNPLYNFKIFTINNLFKELRGNYLDQKVINLGFKVLPNYSYGVLKEASEIIFKSFKIDESENEDLIRYKNALEEENLLNINEDLVLLLKSRKILFINFKDSTLVKSLIEEFGLEKYEFIEISSFINNNSPIFYHKFFNIFDETHYGVNEFLREISVGRDPSKIKVVLDTKRFGFYLNLFTGDVDVPINFSNVYTLLDTKTYQFIFDYLEDDDNSILKILADNKELIDDPYFDDVYDALAKYNIDDHKHKKSDVIDILHSINRSDDEYSNAIKVLSSPYFSIDDSIYVFGLDSTFIPKAKKDDKFFSYDFRNKMGLDSLNEVNLMNSKIENAFLKQKNIRYISFHFKDNGGRYQQSYYIKSLKMIESENLPQLYEFSEASIKAIYRKLFDDFCEQPDRNNYSLALYKKYYNNRLLHGFSSKWSGIADKNLFKNFKFSYTKLKSYWACPFKFYLENVLHLGCFEESREIKFGNIAHAIFEHIYDDDFDFDRVKDEELRKFYEDGNTFSKQEETFLERFIYEIRSAVKLTLEHKKNMSFKKSYSEYEIWSSLNEEVYRINEGKIVKDDLDIKLYGKIDSIIEVFSQRNGLFLIDYKTGNENFNYNQFVSSNVSTQLPFYKYLVEHADNHEFDSNQVDGAFIRHLIANEGNFYNFMNPTEDNFKPLKLNGFCIKNIDEMCEFDYSIKNKMDDPTSDKKSDFISGLKLTKGNEISSQGSLAKEEKDLIKMDEIFKKYILNCYVGINDSDFSIEPIDNRYNLKNSAAQNTCKYCDFKDICMLSAISDEDEDDENGEDWFF